MHSFPSENENRNGFFITIVMNFEQKRFELVNRIRGVTDSLLRSQLIDELSELNIREKKEQIERQEEEEAMAKARNEQLLQKEREEALALARERFYKADEFIEWFVMNNPGCTLDFGQLFIKTRLRPNPRPCIESLTRIASALGICIVVKNFLTQIVSIIDFSDKLTKNTRVKVYIDTDKDQVSSMETFEMLIKKR